MAAIAEDSWYAQGANAATIRHCAEVWRRFWHGGTVLELGPAEGIMTDTLVEHFDAVTVVDGSESFCAKLRERYPQISVVHSLFEDYSPDRQFGTIVLGHVLEHVDDPRELLSRVGGWLTPDGAIYAAVPNARSIHRQAAVIMGSLGSIYDLNDTDRHHGHRRVYDPESLQADFRGAGLRIDVFGGYWLKPVSNGQIERDWTPEMLEAFMQLGERYPDIAGEIYVVARRCRP
ncbi:MAG TPA: class I SAM-dependent methyltransferase [Acidimicrobiales bacterium]|nr:class I SAM-dependent methyltransferase [Acidimicrobiales bacterium]